MKMVPVIGGNVRKGGYEKMKNAVVATYDYYTLEQAERILYGQRKKRKRRKEMIDQVKINLMLFSFYVLVPVYLVISWMISGY